jgi:hypothetical protein
MKSLIAGFGLLYFTCGPAIADHHICPRQPCPTAVEIVSLNEGKVYGLLLSAPKTGCRRLRYRIETTGHDLLGLSPVLLPGEMAVVRIGSGYTVGFHKLLVWAEGCSPASIHARRVTLRKGSPDHGWRASVILASASPDPAF